jgi:hypothetical protein
MDLHHLLLAGLPAHSAIPPKAAAAFADWRVRFGPIVLQNSKMTRQQNFAARPSDRVFGDPMPRKELTKTVG